MKKTVLKRSTALLLVLLCLIAVFSLPAAAKENRVYDPVGMLTNAEASALATRMDELSKNSDVELYLATYLADDRYDDFYGRDYCSRVQNLNGTDAVLLVVTYEERNRTFYYNVYTYGAANYAINQKEINYILDDSDVYYSLKSGYVHDGATAFFELAGTAYSGRLGAPIALIIVIAAAISVGIAFAIRGVVVAVYRKKRATVDYPLDRYAKLELTHREDHYVTEHTTRTYSPRSSGGSSGGGRHGGGGGHRGGR